MVFLNSGAMVSEGFDLEKDQQMRIIVTNPILRKLCVLFRIQITLLLVNFRLGWWRELHSRSGPRRDLLRSVIQLFKLGRLEILGVNQP